MTAILALRDGTCFVGRAFGARDVETIGEVVFSTAMTGYPELLTDPSFCEQILTLTYPEIGNYGVNLADAESGRIQASGLVAREISPVASNWCSELTLDEWLKREGVPGICGIDTRALVQHVREKGAMMGILSTRANADRAQLITRARTLGTMAGRDLVSVVTTKKSYEWSEKGGEFRVVVVDYGVKRNTLRLLVDHGCRVTVVPAHATAKEILAYEPDGVLLSNGPGDPEAVTQGIQTVKDLLGRIPIFGICMGHQILALALGGKTYKLKFGHRGANQPVFDESGRVLISSQNHGFAVEQSSLKEADIAGWQVNGSDGTVEGLDAPKRWAFSVQYHPEGAPGPHDAQHLFGKFISLMDTFKKCPKTFTAENTR